MKTNALLFGLIAITTFIVSPLRSQDQTPIIPVGSLSAFPTIVQAGTHPDLTWDVTLPERVDDIITIEPPGTLVPKRSMIMDVRVIGASVKRVWINSRGQITNWEWVPTEAQMNYNGSGYSRFFYNTQDNVNPNSGLVTKVVEKDSTINFGARYLNSNGSWSTWYSSTNAQYNVVALKNGDTPPTTTPLYQQPTIESFILPYLDNNGNISIGARDIIYLMELTHTDRNHGGFDLQDMVLLVTFYDEMVHNGVTSTCAGSTTTGGTTTTTTTGNNGHGNNVDGVDSSNPGNAPFTDTDPNVDDEGQRGKRKK
jgi:hypothetical protein